MLSSTSTSMFRSVDVITINGGDFTLNNNVLPGGMSKLSLKTITNSASPNAFYDSAANQRELSNNPAADPYNYHALDWIRNRNSTSIMWFCGKSRALTSSIARRTAEFCGSDQQKTLLATFFFSETDPSRNSAKHFIASLAYGIIQSIPNFRTAITEAVENDPLIFSGSIEKQFEKLIFDPLNRLYSTHQDSTLPYVIIIDALDECEHASERTQILGLFDTARLNVRQQDWLPWKVLFTSRPDQMISKAFGRLPNSLASHKILPEQHVGRNLQEKATTSRTPILAPSIPKSGPSKNPVQPLASPSRGLRLLSIDGGGIRGLSALIILEEMMHRLKFPMELKDPPKPCEVFDLAGGTGTGGLIVIMLFRLRMSAKDATDAYARFTKFVFSERKWSFQGETFKASRLEQAILTLISEQLGISIEEAKTERMVDETTGKCFVCASPSHSMRQPTLFRTWDARKSHHNVTILEAARATCTMPGLFKNAEIVNGEMTESFVDAAYGWNNPVYYVLEEAKILFPTLSCIVSLGTGLESVIEFPKPSAFQRLLPTRLVQVFKDIAKDCEKTAEEAVREYGAESDFYFRLNVEQGMDRISLEEWEKSSEVVTHTKQYLRRREVSRKVDKLVDVLHPPTASGNVAGS